MKLPSTQAKKGAFITFEGGEGAGKTTLIKEIVRQLELEGYSVIHTREPGGTKLGESIREILLKNEEPISVYSELCLFLASRAQHIMELIGPAIEEGKVVLCDRFNDSSIAYQGAARGLGMEKVASFCDFISQGLKPNLTIYLDLEPELGLSRASRAREPDRIEAESISFHGKIREAYLKLHKMEPHRFRLVNATLEPARVYQEAMRLIRPIL